MWRAILFIALACQGIAQTLITSDLVATWGSYSVFNPSNIASMLLWVQGDSFSNNANGTQLQLWPDISGRGNHFTNETLARSPYVTNSVVNGHSAVKFPGSVIDFRWLSNSTGFATGATQGEMFAVLRSAKQASDAQVDTPWSFKLADGSASAHPSTVGKAQEQFGLSSASTSGVDLTNNYNSVSIFTNFHIWNASVFPNEYIIRYNGDIVGGNDFFTNTAIGFSNQLFFSRTPDNAHTWNGEIAEFMMFSNVLTTAQRQNIYDYFSNRYAIVCTNQSVPFAPTNLPGVKAWWVASDVNTNAGSPVTNWLDRISGINATNRSGVTPPTYQPTLVNGLPGLQFLGTASNQTLHLDATINLTNYAAVIIGSETNAANVITGTGASGGSQWITKQPPTLNDTWFFVSGAQVIKTFPRGSNQVTMDLWTRSGSTVFIGQNATNSSSGSLATTAVFDSIFTPLGRSADVVLAEILIFQQSVTPEKLCKLYYKYYRPLYLLP